MKKNKLAPVILAVDDNPKNLQVIASMLKEWGYRAVMAQSGSQCLDYLKDNTPDMILMDVLMPGLNGYDTSAAVKTSMKNRNIPILFITALSDPDSIVKGFKSGGVDYITKPFIREEVQARIKVHLELKSTLDMLQNISITDEMTGTYNRRHAVTIFERELKFAKRLSQQFIVSCIDIDNLKQINDTHGHEAGDILIKKVVETIKGGIRESDYLFRMGGDEFMLILPDTDMDNGTIMIDRLRQQTGRESVMGVPVDFSYGLAVFEPDHDNTLDKLMKLADQRMYDQKIKKKKR